MKICFFHPELVIAGAERVMNILTKNWIDSGHEVTILYIEKEKTHNDFYDFSYGGKIKLVPLWDLPTGRIRFRLALRAIFAKENPDIVVSFMNGTNILATSILKPFSNYKLIISERSNPIYENYSFLDRLKQKLYYRLADKMVFQTKRALDFGVPYFGIKKHRSCIIHNPVRIPRELGSAPKLPSKSIVAVGRLNKSKGFDLLLSAFSRIAIEFIDWNLYICGGGEEYEALHKMIIELRLENKVHLLGPIKDVYGVYRQAEIFVLPSRYEGLPNALIEAMSVGVPSVSFDCQFGPSELIDNDVNGLLVPNGDVAAMANALKKLMKDEKLRQSFREKSPQYLTLYNEKTIAADWEKLFHELIDKKIDYEFSRHKNES